MYKHIHALKYRYMKHNCIDKLDNKIVIQIISFHVYSLTYSNSYREQFNTFHCWERQTSQRASRMYSLMYSNSYREYFNTFHCWERQTSPRASRTLTISTNQKAKGRGDRSSRCVYNASIWSLDGQQRQIRTSRVSRLTNNCFKFSLHCFILFFFFFKNFCSTYFFSKKN